MSSRGRFSSRFIKSGNYQRPSNSDRDSSFRRDRTNERSRQSVLGGRGASIEHFHRWDSDTEHVSFEHSRGRERGYAKRNTRSYIRSPRSRYSRGYQINNEQERKIHSLRHYKQRGHGRFSEDKRRIFGDIDDEEFLILSDTDDLELQFPIEPVDSSDENEAFDDCKIPLEREMSPLIIHRSFERESLKSDSQERTFGRSRSPLDSRHRSFVSFGHKTSFGRVSKRSSFSRRTLSKSPRSSQDRLDRNHKGSIVRSVVSFRTSNSNKRSKERELFREENVESNSLALIRKQIEHEKQRQRFLERQTRRHKKRSESSVERLLNECKTSIEMRSESSPTNISSYHTQNTKQSGIEKMYTEDSSSPNVTILEPKKLDTIVQLDISEHKNSSNGLDTTTISKKENSTNNSPEIRPELSPISQAGSFDVVELSPDKKDLHENILNLSPISQEESYEKKEFSDHVENRLDLSPISQTGSFEDADRNDKPVENELLLSPVSQASSFDHIDKKSELSSISQPGSFEKREFSQDQVFSPISLGESFGKDDLECVPTQKSDIERPNSADSLQKFLEEFRDTDGMDGSRSPSSVSSKKGTKNTFPRNVTNNSTLEFDTGNDRYQQEYYSGNDNVSKVKNNNIDGIRTSYRNPPFHEMVNHPFHEMVEKIFGSHIHSSDTKRKKYDAYNTNIQYESTSDQLTYNISQGFESSKNAHNLRSKGNNFLPNEKGNKHIFQDNPKFSYSHNKVITSNEMLTQNLNQSSFLQHVRNKAQSFTNHPPSSALYNKLSGSNQHHSLNSINHLNVNENMNRKIQNIQQDTYQVPVKNVPRNEFPDSSHNISLFINKVTQYKPINQGYNQFNQELQTHQTPTFSKNYSDSGYNYRIAESINKNQQYQPVKQIGTQIMPIQNKLQTQITPYNTFTQGSNQSLPNSSPGVLNTNSQNKHLPYQAGQTGLTLQRSLQNIQVNQTVLPWNLRRDDSNNQPSTFGEGYGRPNESVRENSLYQTNRTVSQPQHMLGFQNPSIFKETHVQNEIPLNQGQSYLAQRTRFSQSQVQNVSTNYKTLIPDKSLIQCLDRPPPPLPHFQQIQCNAGISNTVMPTELEKSTLAPSSTFPDYNRQNLPFTNSDRLNQCMPFQSNIPPPYHGTAQGQYGYNNSQNIQENSGSSQSATPRTFLSDPKNLLGLQCSEMNKAPNQNLNVLKQLTYVDLKKYLSGTFKPDYKSALGLNVSSDCGGSSHLIGDYQPPVRACFPNPMLTMRFKDTPASPDELGVMFDKFVIFFDVKQNSELEEDPFVIIQDSFSKSDRFGRLNVEELPQFSYPVIQPPSKHSCVLRWKGVMLARANGHTQAEARQKASISLINALAHTCYTVQSKYSYYFGGKLTKLMQKAPETPGVYKIIRKNDVIKSVTDILQMMKVRGIHHVYSGNKRVDPTNINVVLNLIEDFFLTEKHSHTELILGADGPMGFTIVDLKLISEHVNRYDFLQWRSIKGFGRSTYIAISRRFTPQELCSFLLAIQDNNARYKLLPPQEPGVELLMPDGQYNFNINKSIVGFQKPVSSVHIQPENSETFQRTVPLHGGGRGGGHNGNWMRFP